ncbi:MAG: hypothetical protein EA339_15010 [Rhodobacteraceae bacterium]|nr:MAG: hypothetical protein EA339_15010 [Paracoccaceae bacterium]
MPQMPDSAVLLQIAAAPQLRQPDRALTLCRALGLGESAADMPLGARDAALMRLRIAMSGPDVPCVDTCPSCRTELELVAPLPDLLALQNGDVVPLVLSDGPCDARPLSARDLVAVADLPRREARAQLARAVAGRAVAADDLTTVEDWLEAADPLAHVTFDLACSACGTAWSRVFDIVPVLWEELRANARGLITEIHTLASAYHWTEAEILAVPPERRALYLSMVAP